MGMGKFKEKITSYKITNNLNLKIISVLFAIVVWLIVVNVGDPVTTKVYKDVPVTVLHEEFLTEEGQIYQVLENTDTVDITVRARRSVLKDIKEDDFSVTADMRELIFMESVRIAVTCEKYEDKIEAISQSHDTLLVSIEEKESTEFTVELETLGTPQEGFTIGKTSFQPANITVSGPKSIVSRVNKVVARVDVEGTTAQVVDEMVMPILYDANGEVITDSHLTLSSQSCRVTVPIWPTKSVAVAITPSGEVAAGYSYDRVSCYPTAITITGEQELLDKVTEIEIPEGVVDITDASENLEMRLDIERYLPDGIYLVDKNDATIRVTVGVSSQVTRSYQIAVNQIGLLNAPEDYRVSFDVTQVSVVLRGTASELEQMSEADIKCTVDLDGLEIGTHRLPLEIVASGNAQVVDQVQITVYIQEKAAQNVGSETQNTTE